MQFSGEARKALAALLASSGVLTAGCAHQPAPEAPRAPQWERPAESPAPAVPVEHRDALLAEAQPALAVALLLPRSGPAAAPGSGQHPARRFFWAHFDSPQPRPAVRVYDSGAGRRTALAAFDSALADGAQLIVGPLSKPQVDALIDMRSSSVPVLALNFADSSESHSPAFHQISLAPEDELRQAAESAIDQGLLHAIALIEEGDWGQRVFSAFVERYRELGGEVLDSRTYADGAKDFAAEIRALTGVAASEERDRALSAILGRRLKFEPQRRHDAEMVFVVADADATRMMMPELRFYRARRLPVYGTASVFDGSIRSSDRDGLRFCDAPITVQRDGNYAQMRASVEEALHLSASDARVFGLGGDAYRVGLAIASGGLTVGEAFDGASGRLWMSADGILHRTLPCAEVSHGELLLIEAAQTDPPG